MIIAWIPLIIAIATNGAIDWAIFCRLRRSGHQGLAITHLVLAIALHVMLIAALAMPHTSNTSFVMLMWALFIFFAFYVPKYVGLLISWPSHLLRKWPRVARAFHWCGTAVAAVIFGAMWWGALVTPHRIAVEQVTVESPHLPAAFDGYRIVQFSDAHLGTNLNDTTAASAWVDTINALKPDVIMFTGDLVSRITSEAAPFETVLRRLHAPDGVYSILGNHDFFIYSPEYHNDRERSEAADRLTRLEEDSLGWRVVRNSSIMLRRGGDSIAVAGVDNINGGEGFATIQKGDLGRAIEGLEGVFTVMMTHDPSHWRAEVLPRSEAQLTLSGHTHAAQFRILGWSLSNLFFSECDGRYDEGERTLYHATGSYRAEGLLYDYQFVQTDRERLRMEVVSKTWTDPKSPRKYSLRVTARDLHSDAPVAWSREAGLSKGWNRRVVNSFDVSDLPVGFYWMHLEYLDDAGKVVQTDRFRYFRAPEKMPCVELT